MAISNFADRIQRNLDTANLRDFTSFGGRIAGRFITGVDEPQRAYMWEVQMRGGEETLENLLLYAREVTIPESTNEVIQRNYLGKMFQEAGKESSPKICEVTFWDDQSLAVYRHFMHFFQIMQDPQLGSQVHKENYYRDFYIRLKDTSDLYATGTIVLKDVLVSNVGEVSLSYESNELFQFSVSLAFNQKLVN